MRLRKWACVGCAAFAVASLAMPAFGAPMQERQGDRDTHGRESQDRDLHDRDFHDRDVHGRDYHGRDFRRFSRVERDRWRGGHWHHGWHGGHFAWWWVVDGFWYYYPEPFYPYPTYVPPVVTVRPAPPAPSGPPPAQYWYYCDSPKGYYPYVETCDRPWRPVPVKPPSTSSATTKK